LTPLPGGPPLSVLDHEPWLDRLPGRKDMINVDDWAEIRRLYFAERLPVARAVANRYIYIFIDIRKFRSVD